MGPVNEIAFNRFKKCLDLGPDLFGGELGQTVVFGERTVVEARSERTDVANEHFMVCSPWMEPSVFARSKEREDRTAESRGDVHRSAIVAHNEIGFLHQRYEGGKGERFDGVVGEGCQTATEAITVANKRERER